MNKAHGLIMREGGFALMLSLVLSALASLVALEAFNRSQLDARLARLAVAGTQADVAALGLLEALLADIGSGLDIPLPGVDTAVQVCSPDGPCDERYTRVSALREQLPDDLQPTVSIVAVSGVYVPRLAQQYSSSARLGGTRILEGRVEIAGAARASMASTFVIMRPLLSLAPDSAQ